MNERQRHVILVRHANAEWPAYYGTDFDRPLTPQGLEDASSTAAALCDATYRPEVLLTSPSRRTLQTSEIIATALGLPDSAVIQVDALYNAPPDILSAELKRALATVDTVMLVAHNPGISEVARKLTGNTTFAAFRPAHWLYVAWRD